MRQMAYVNQNTISSAMRSRLNASAGAAYLKTTAGWVEDPNIRGTKTICWQYQYDVNRHTNYKQVCRRDLK